MIVQQKADNYKSGWIVTFLIIVREDGPSSGYVSTGFFGGKYLVTLRFLQESSSTRVKLFSLGLTLSPVVLIKVTKGKLYSTIPGESIYLEKRFGL